MKEEKDIVSEAVEQMKGGAIPPGPSIDLTDATVARLSQMTQDSPEQGSRYMGLFDRLHNPHSLPRLTIKFAVAAVLVLFVGFATGRLTGPTPPDVEELYSQLKPALEKSVEKALYEKVSEEIDQRWRLALERTCFALKDELTRQYREDLNQFATQMLVASNAETNRLLGDLVVSLDEAKSQDMQCIARAIYDLDQQRLKDKTQIAKGLQTLTYTVDDQLQRTWQHVSQLFEDRQVETLQLDQIDNQNPFDNRKE